MSLKLLTVESAIPDGLKLTYEVGHSTPGREGTYLKEEMTLLVYPRSAIASMTIPECDAPTADEALKRLSGWLRRLADGLDQRGESIQLPLT